MLPFLNMAARAVTITCYLNKVAILQYGGLARYLNYLNKTTMLQYDFKLFTTLERGGESGKYQTHN